MLIQVEGDRGGSSGGGPSYETFLREQKCFFKELLDAQEVRLLASIKDAVAGVLRPADGTDAEFSQPIGKNVQFDTPDAAHNDEEESKMTKRSSEISTISLDRGLDEDADPSVCRYPSEKRPTDRNSRGSSDMMLK